MFCVLFSVWKIFRPELYHWSLALTVPPSPPPPPPFPCSGSETASQYWQRQTPPVSSHTNCQLGRILRGILKNRYRFQWSGLSTLRQPLGGNITADSVSLTPHWPCSGCRLEVKIELCFIRRLAGPSDITRTTYLQRELMVVGATSHRRPVTQFYVETNQPAFSA